MYHEKKKSFTTILLHNKWCSVLERHIARMKTGAPCNIFADEPYEKGPFGTPVRM
jgi:hypothetical protein